MELSIREANTQDFCRIKDFYAGLIDAFDQMEYRPLWEKGVYPSDEMISAAIDAGELFVADSDDMVVSAMFANHAFDEIYDELNWAIDADDTEVIVIHALGVHQDFHRQGIATKMVDFVIERARSQHLKAVRLDVVEENLGAIWAYESMGFRFAGGASLLYEPLGLMRLRLYEYVL